MTKYKISLILGFIVLIIGIFILNISAANDTPPTSFHIDTSEGGSAKFGSSIGLKNNDDAITQGTVVDGADGVVSVEFIGKDSALTLKNPTLKKNLMYTSLESGSKISFDKFGDPKTATIVTSGVTSVVLGYNPSNEDPSASKDGKTYMSLGNLPKGTNISYADGKADIKFAKTPAEIELQLLDSNGGKTVSRKIKIERGSRLTIGDTKKSIAELGENIQLWQSYAAFSEVKDDIYTISAVTERDETDLKQTFTISGLEGVSFNGGAIISKNRTYLLPDTNLVDEKDKIIFKTSSRDYFQFFQYDSPVETPENRYEDSELDRELKLFPNMLVKEKTSDSVPVIAVFRNVNYYADTPNPRVPGVFNAEGRIESEAMQILGFLPGNPYLKVSSPVFLASAGSAMAHATESKLKLIHFERGPEIANGNDGDEYMLLAYEGDRGDLWFKRDGSVSFGPPKKSIAGDFTIIYDKMEFESKTPGFLQRLSGNKGSLTISFNSGEYTRLPVYSKLPLRTSATISPDGNIKFETYP